MISTGGLAGFWVIALLALRGVTGETRTNSLGEPDIPFPPARPTTQNIVAICQQGQGRPRYPDSFFPSSRVSHFRRLGKAVNRLESWYTLCCSGQTQYSTQVICCAEQAWKQALSQFCVEEYATMTRAYECCADRGDARWTCFDSELPNPNYDPTPGYTAPSVPREAGFIFNPHAC
ncbi:Extracellular matrix protein 1 [Nibea albiflora]|uniref:Extracellular matrix protein 1 n=1 Tax=Nibea albiflora TaxID=240163 RepID=A0ACB7EU61_NIBAL|nr:Extracellular matrix protein 1 [Nibea albiflora]